MKKIVIDTDQATTWLGYIASLLLILQNQGIITENFKAFALAVITALFGYLTNKVRIKKEPLNKNKTDIAGLEFDV